MNKELVIVTVAYSYDAEVVALVFDDYEKACDYIREDFEEVKRLNVEVDGNEINEEETYCKEDIAVLSTSYKGETDTITWTIARAIDKR